MMELVISTDLTSLPSAIEFNYDELKSGVENYLAKFNGLVVTEDGIKAAKDDRARINKIESAIATARKDTKTRYLKPFESFEEKAKELEGLCKKASEFIGKQLDAYELKRMKEKHESLAKLWDEVIGFNLGGKEFHDEAMESNHWRTFFDYWTNERTKGCWLNKSVSVDEAEKMMTDEVVRCVKAVESVDSLFESESVELRTKARIAICRDFDFNSTVAEVNAWKAEQKRIEQARIAAEERRKAIEAERAAREAELKNAPTTPTAPQPSTAETAKAQDVQETQIPHVKAEPEYFYVLKITGTMPELKKLRAMMDATNLKFEKLSEGFVQK